MECHDSDSQTRIPHVVNDDDELLVTKFRQDSLDLQSPDASKSASSCGSFRNVTMARGDIEDRFHQMAEENLQLKKDLRKQEEQVKQLATKLVRFVNDKKNREKREDLLLLEQKNRISELEHQCLELKEKLQVTRIQLSSCTKLCPGGSATSVASRSSRGQSHSVVLRKSPRSTTVLTNKSSRIVEPRPFRSMWEVPEKVEHLLLEARRENQSLEDKIKTLQKQLNQSDIELKETKEQLRINEMKYQEEVVKLNNALESETNLKRKKVSENINIIKVQREAKKTASWLSAVEVQCKSLEAKLTSANETIEQLEMQIEHSQEELKKEQERHLLVQKQLEQAQNDATQNKEIQMQLQGIQDENRILKETNKSLVDKAFQSAENFKVSNTSSEIPQEMKRLREELDQVLDGKQQLGERLAAEEKRVYDLEKLVQSQKLQIKQLEQETERMAEDVKNAQENKSKIEVENLFVEPKIEKSEHEESPGECLTDQCQKCATLETELNQAQWQLVQMKDELDRTRQLLRTQITINHEHQKEIESLNIKMEKVEVIQQEKLQSFLNTLEKRAQQMAGLERILEVMNLEKQVDRTEQNFNQ